MKGNVLKIRSLKARSAWCDKDRVMLHACFQLLADFVDQEKPQTFVDYKTNPAQRRKWREIMALYRYWTVERPKAEKAVDQALRKWHKGYKKKWVPEPDGSERLVVLRESKRDRERLHRLEARFERRDEAMLRRLIDVRRHLWC